MIVGNNESDVLARLSDWAEQQPLVRAMVLQSSRAHNRVAIDAFSDYDILLVVSDSQPFVTDDAWLGDLGTPRVVFRDAMLVEGMQAYSRLVLYMDGTKIDYMIWPVALLRQSVERQQSLSLLDWGYRVLLDKDALTDGLPAPTRTAHILARPTEQEYRALVEEFWWESIYVAKNLWRDDLMFAKYNLDVVMRHDLLRRLLNWRVASDHAWSWKPGLAGRGLKKYLPPDLWTALKATWTGAGIEENWEALFAMTALFRRVATEVGAALGYAYLIDLDQHVTAYLQAARAMPH